MLNAFGTLFITHYLVNAEILPTELFAAFNAFANLV